MRILLILLVLPICVIAQPVINQYPSLSVSADARGWGMGGAGIASASTRQALGANVSKTAFAQYFHQAGASYIPWMRSVSDDAKLMRLDYVGAVSNTSALGLAINFLDMGSVAMRNEYGATLGYYHANEFNVGGSYALQLGSTASLGATMRLIGSKYFEDGFVNRYSVSGDIGYAQFLSFGDGAKLEWGATISNLGANINLPTTAGIGMSYSFHDQQNNQFCFALDGSRLISAKQIRLNTGAEWAYAEQFFARAGIGIETVSDGNRKFISLGCGYKGFVNDQSWGLDLFYLIPFGTKAVQSPFQNTLGLTLSLNIGNFQ